VDVPALLQQLLRILKASIGKNTDITIHLPDDSSHILVAPESQIYQILLNLCINSIQAMEGEGVLRLHLKRKDSELCLIVEDEGPGMEREVMEHLFTPMMSTKRERGGSGLGLVMVKQIADNLGAKVEVVSDQGQGTRVMITFPEAYDERGEDS
jgi:signal transduction histidine kinase